MKRMALALVAALSLYANVGCTAIVGRSRLRDRELEEIKESLREIRTNLDWLRSIVIENRCAQTGSGYGFDDLLPGELEE